MKTLKILTVAFIASLFMLACEDTSVDPQTGPIVGERFGDLDDQDVPGLY